MANTYTLIEAKTLGSAVASVQFTSIPSTYTDLILLSSYRGTNGSTFDQMRITFNGTNISQWSFRGLYGEGANAASESSSSQDSGKIALGIGTAATANTFTNDCHYIPNYLSSNNKSISSDVVGENNATTAYMGLYANLRSQTTAINTITLESQNSTNFVQYSSFYLYGISNS